MQTSFGAGGAWITPLTDGFGASIALPSPARLGLFQDFSLDYSRETKELYGQAAYAADFGAGKVKLSGKLKNGAISHTTWNLLVFGQTISTGQTLAQADDTGTAVPTTPFQITVTPPNSGTWAADLGVRNASGQPMTRVSSAPATGQYSVAAGVYTFASADVGTKVYMDYRYTLATTGKTITLTSVAMGEVPTFMLEYRGIKNGKQLYIQLPFCVVTKFALDPKQDDFLMPEFDFQAGAGLLNGSPLTLSGAE